MTSKQPEPQLELTSFSLEDVSLLVVAGGYAKPMHECSLQELMAVPDKQQKFEELFAKEFGGIDGVTNDGTGTGEE